MPLKCLTCDKVFQDKSEVNCDKDDCHVVQVETIHFLSPNGKGKLKVKELKHGILNGQEIEYKKEKVQLYLACDHNGNEAATVCQSIITCKKCLEFMASTSNPDISDISQQQGQ